MSQRRLSKKSIKKTLGLLVDRYVDHNHDPDPDPDLHPDPGAERSKVLNFRFPGLVQRGDHSDKKSFNKQAFGRMQVLNILF